MRTIEALILIGQSLIYGGAARTLFLLAYDRNVLWAVAAAIASWLMELFSLRWNGNWPVRTAGR